MSEPELYGRYSSEEVARLFSVEVPPEEWRQSPWLLRPDHLLCLAEVGTSLESPHLSHAACFYWPSGGPPSQAPSLPGLPNEIRRASKAPSWPQPG